MTQEVVNVGTEANDGLGDTLRSGFVKTNNNFIEMFNATILNLGSDEALFTTKQGADFLIKGIGAGPNASITSNSTSIIIDLFGGSGDVSGGFNLSPGEGVFAQKNSGILEFKGLAAGPNVILTSNSISIEIDSVLVASVVGASNLGLGVGVFFEKNGDVLEFRSVSSANTANIIISGNATSVIIDAFGGGGTLSGAANITAGPGEGVFAQENSGVLEFRSLTSANSSNVIITTANNTNITIDAFVDKISDTTRFYDIFIYVPSTMLDGELLHEIVFPRQVDFDLDLANSETFAGLTSTAAANIAIQKNDVVIGNIVFAAATAEATFDLPGGATFADEDRITFVAPASADATLGNVRISIVGSTTISGGGAGDNAVTGGANLTPGVGVFAQQAGAILEFRALASANTSNIVVVSANATTIDIDSFSSVVNAANITAGPGEGVFAQKNGDVLEFRSLTSANTANVIVSTANNTNIIIDAFVGAGGGGSTAHTEATVQTTNATKTNIATGALASGEVATIEAAGQGIETATGDVYWFSITGGVKNISGITSLVGTASITSDNDTGAASWTVGLEADDTGDDWVLTVTGQASKTIEWKISYVEVKQ